MDNISLKFNSKLQNLNNSNVSKLNSDKKLKELKEIVSKYSDYETPFIRSDGDIIIALKKSVKKKRQTTQSLAEAVKFMMNESQAVRVKK